MNIKEQLRQAPLTTLIALHNYDNQYGDVIYQKAFNDVNEWHENIPDNDYYYRIYIDGDWIGFDTLEESPIDIDALAEWLERDTETAEKYLGE